MRAVRPTGRAVRAWIVAGERRWRATCEAIDEGDLSTDFPMPCQVRQMTDAEHLRLAIAENLIRVDLNHVEQGEGFRALMELGGETPQTIASTVNRTDEYVRQHLRILNLPPSRWTSCDVALSPCTAPWSSNGSKERRETAGAGAAAAKRSHAGAAGSDAGAVIGDRIDEKSSGPARHEHQPDLLPPDIEEAARISAKRADDRERKIDDEAVDAFAAQMKEKLAEARANGRAGWHDSHLCTVASLTDLLLNHVAKGDPIDIAILRCSSVSGPATSAPFTTSASGRLNGGCGSLSDRIRTNRALIGSN